MTTWADVEKGDRVKLAGRVYRVRKIKPKGKKARVVVEHKGIRAGESVVKLKDRVEKVDTLTGSDGRQKRWATPKELAQVLEPPKPAEGKDWTKAQGKIERVVGDELGARLIGEADDTGVGYYVPPCDVTTIALHLLVFHGGTGDLVDERTMLAEHEKMHAAALKGSPLEVNHWHTEKRP